MKYITQRKTNTIWYHFRLDSKKSKQMNKENKNKNRLMETENKLIVARGKEVGEWAKNVTGT